jgi:hypothetical protein
VYICIHSYNIKIYSIENDNDSRKEKEKKKKRIITAKKGITSMGCAWGWGFYALTPLISNPITLVI